MDDPEARSVLGMRIPVLVVVTSIVIGAVVAFVSYVTGRFSTRQSDENGSGKQLQDDKADEADSAIEAGKTAAAAAAAATNSSGNGAATSGKRAKNKKRREAQQEFTHSWMVGALKGHTGPVLDMNFSSNGKFLASCAEDCDLTPEEEPEEELKDIEGSPSTVTSVTSSVTSAISTSSSPISTSTSTSKTAKVRPSVPSTPSAVTLTTVKDPQPATLSRRQRKNRTRAPREQQRRLDDDADDDNPDFLPHHRPHHHRRSSPSRLRHHHRPLNSRHFHQESPTRDSTDSSASTTTTRTTSSSSPRTPGNPRRAQGQGQGQSSSSSKVTDVDPSHQGRENSTLKTLTLGTSAKVNLKVTPKITSAGPGGHPGTVGKKSKNSPQGHLKVSSQRDELNHLSDAALASLLRRYTLTGMQLAHLGYPVECSYFPGCAVILNHQQHPQGHRLPRGGHRPHNLDANAREFVPGKNNSGVEKSTWTTESEVDSGNGSGSSLESSDLEPESASDSDKSSDIGESSSSSSSASSTSSSSSSSSSSASSTSSGYEKPRRSSQGSELWDQGHIERPCVRCHRSFYVTREEGKYVGDEKCRYHWGKLRNGHDRRQRDRWECCQGHEDAAGCTEAKAHVWTGLTPGYNGPFEGYARTRPSRTVARDGNYGVFALDCEMCFTRRGLELAKVTLVGMDGEVVYDALVKPEDEVIDHNTRFSGITADDLERATKTLRDVQKDITTFVHAETILIGHGLENDLRALRLLHTTVIDTCVAFPHFLGYPFRSSLKTLARTVLKKEIQVTEHDSVEDARIAVDLMLRRLQHDLY